MSMRERINSVIASSDELTVRSVSLAAGLSDSMLGKFLKNDTESMTIKKAEDIAKALGVDPVWLVFGEGSPERATDVAEKFGRLSEKHQELVRQMIESLPRTGTNG